MTGSWSWWLKRPLRIAAGIWRRDPEYLARLGLLKLARLLPGHNAAALPTDAAALGLLRGAARFDASPRGLLVSALPDLMPLLTYPDPGPAAGGRLTLLTDSLDAGSQFGDAATAILFAVALARHRRLRLRVVTRHSPPEPANVGAVLESHGITYSENIDFEYAPAGTGTRELAVAAHELIVTTSWSTTWAALQSFDPSRIIYLVQEDERVFYPAGEEQLRCREILCHRRLRFAVSTSTLLNYLTAEGMTGIAERGVAFAPALPSAIYYQQTKPPASNHCFLFFARSNHPRNLLLRGLEALARAIETDVLPAPDWDLYIVGQDLPRIELPRGVQPRVVGALPWQDSIALLRQVDVALTLGYRPQYSGPALELAACGAVVVTNRYGPKPPLDATCANILCVEPSVDGLVAGLEHAVQLAANAPQRQANYAGARLNRDWDAAFTPVLETLAGP